jgi:[calcium/calmodulin-dependent protein kinase] kinase
MLSSLHSPIETSILEVSRDEEGNKKINNYIVMRELGRGGFGKVMLVYVKERNEYFVFILFIHKAMKVANKSKLKRKLLSRAKSAYTLLEQEIAIMKKLDHVNTVKLVEVIDDPE